MDDDVEIQLERLRLNALRCECPDRGTPSVGQQELVAVLDRYDEGFCLRRGKQQPHTGRSEVNVESLQRLSSERYPSHVRRQELDPPNDHAAKRRWFSPDPYESVADLRRTHCESNIVTPELAHYTRRRRRIER